MRNKKLVSTVVASAVVATTVALPVAAADENSLDVEFTTKTPVIRVVTPTSILAAVDPLEMNTTGTQIHSTDFTLVNKSEVPVKIDVKSVVTLGSGVTLVDTKKEAVDSKDNTKSDAWLAVAAETSNKKYIETANKTAGDLNEMDKNVATFKTESAESSASQTFYLDKASGATTGYTLIAPATTGGTTASEYKEQLTYAQIYELTDVSTSITNDATLLAQLKTKDIYVGTADTDNTTLKLLPAGTTSLDAADQWAASNKYFTADTENALTSTAKPITDGKKYVYGETSAAGSDTAFRYIGKLGSGKTSWSDADIDEMSITYSIYGLTGEAYAAANTQYGLYLAGPQITVSDTGLITISNLTADQNYKGLTIENSNGGPYEIGSAPVTWNEENYNPLTGGTTTCQLGEVWLETLRGITGKAHLTLTDNTTITIEINIPAAP
jgi:hypothetical protein